MQDQAHMAAASMQQGHMLLVCLGVVLLCTKMLQAATASFQHWEPAQQSGQLGSRGALLCTHPTHQLLAAAALQLGVLLQQAAHLQ